MPSPATFVNSKTFGTGHHIEHDGEVSAGDIQLRPTPGLAVAEPPVNGHSTTAAALGDHLIDIEREAIVKALERPAYNKTAAAKVLGMSFRALRYFESRKLGMNSGAGSSGA